MSGAVLVTGATGFLGRALVARLVERGRPVHALERAGSERGVLASLPVTWHAADLRDGAALERAFAAFARAAGPGAACVHAGAVISYRRGDRALQEAVNVEGTRRVLALARASGLARVVHVGSVVAVGVSRDGEVLDESARFDAHDLGVDYVDTKRAAEELALAERGPTEVVVVDPGAIFGGGSARSNTVRFLRALAGGRTPPFAPPGSLSVVGVDDAAEGTLLALERGRAGERYLLVESWAPTLEVFRTLAAALGARPPARAFPRRLWPAVVAGARLVDRVRPLSLSPPQALVMLGQDLCTTGAKARAELGWRPRPFSEVARATVERLRAEGLLPAPPNG